MKKSLVLLILCFGFLATHAQSNQKFYEGKWKILVKNTPVGDDVFPIRIALLDGKIQGFIFDSDSNAEVPMKSISIEENTLNANFDRMGFELAMTLTKVNDESAEGVINNDYKVLATRLE